MTRSKLRTIFRVESVLWEGGRCPARKTFTFQYGYFTSLQKAEKSIPYLGYTKEVLFYIITEIRLDCGDIDWFEIIQVRTYSAKGKPIDVTKAVEEPEWHWIWYGHDKNQIYHHIGNIVEVFSYFEQKIRLGIVAKLPLTTEEVSGIYEKEDGFRLTIDEDVYGIVFLDGKYQRARSYSVFTPFRTVPNKLEQELRNKLEEYNNKKINHKK